MRPRPAPMAKRRAISFDRAAPRASSKFAKLAQAIKSTRPVTPIRTSRGRRNAPADRSTGSARDQINRGSQAAPDGASRSFAPSWRRQPYGANTTARRALACAIDIPGCGLAARAALRAGFELRGTLGSELRKRRQREGEIRGISDIGSAEPARADPDDL